MLDRKWIKKVESNIINHKAIEITNDEFLKGIFGCDLDKMHNVLICTRSNESSNWLSRAWNRKKENKFSRDHANYFTVSTFKPTENGSFKRELGYVTGTCCIVLDDLTLSDHIDPDDEKAQIPIEKLPLTPTWVIRTSEGNTQVGYKLSSFIENRDLIDHIYEQLKANKFTDPQGANSNKLMRLPIGFNFKKPKIKNSDNHCLLVYWNLKNTYQLDEIMKAFRIPELTEKSSTGKSEKSTSKGSKFYKPCPPEGFVIQAAIARGLNPQWKGDGYELTCPWSNEHTTNGDKAKYYPPNKEWLLGGFSCKHNHCKDKSIYDLLKFLGLSVEHARGRDLIKDVNQETHELNEAITTSLKKTESIYKYNDKVVCVKPGKEKETFNLQILDKSTLKDMLSKCALILSQDAKGEWRAKKVRDILYSDYVNCKNHSSLEELAGIVHHPVILPNGQLINTKGYDSATGFYFTKSLSPHDIRKIESATKEDARKSLKVLLGKLQEFRFCSEEDRSAALFAILTAVERPILDTATMFLVLANGFGAGKTYLSKVICAFTGPRAYVRVLTIPNTKEEFDKLIFSKLLTCPPCICFDNAIKDLRSYDALPSIITAPKYEGRILGSNQVAAVNTNTFMIVNGNKINVYRDLVRRTIKINLDKGTGSQTFKNPNLLESIEKERGQLTAHVLTIVKAYLNANVHTNGGRNLSSFQDQDNLCRQPLLWLGLTDPATRCFIDQDNDPEKVAFAEILKELWILFKGNSFNTADLLTKVRQDIKRRSEWISLFHTIGIDCCEEGNKLELNTSMLGSYMSRQIGDHENEFTLTDNGMKRGQRLYRITKTE